HIVPFVKGIDWDVSFTQLAVVASCRVYYTTRCQLAPLDPAWYSRYMGCDQAPTGRKDTMKLSEILAQAAILPALAEEHGVRVAETAADLPDKISCATPAVIWPWKSPYSGEAHQV